MLQANLLWASTRRLDAQRLEARRGTARAARDERHAHAPVPRRQVRAVYLPAQFLPGAPVGAGGEAVEMTFARGHAQMHRAPAAARETYETSPRDRAARVLLAQPNADHAVADGEAERVLGVAETYETSPRDRAARVLLAQ